jgi:putative transposase
MTSEQKVALVEAAKDTYGLNLTLTAIGLPKATWYYHQKRKVAYEEKYAYLFPILDEIARDHPEYGVPRIMPELHEEYHVDVNHKVVEHLLGIWDLSILRSTHRPRPSCVRKVILEAGERANLVAQMAEIGLFQVVYTDFTEILYAGGHRKAVLMPIIGHVSKAAFGWAVGQSRGTALALQAWEHAKETFRRMGISCQGMIMHHDQDSVYTSYEWTSQLLLKDKSRLSYALGGAKDNPEMESFNGHFKGEAHSLFLEAQSLDELIAVVDGRMRYYNTIRRHSTIGYVSPLTYIQRSRSHLNAQS